MKITTIIAFVLAIIGAIVWGLVGIFDYNVVAAIFGAGGGRDNFPRDLHARGRCGIMAYSLLGYL